MRLAFFGTPGFALPALYALAERHEIVLVVSQPDKPAGRGLATSAPPVARVAAELGLPLAQPARLKGNDDFLEHLASLEPQVAVTAAYGKILPQSLLDVPPHGFLNVHASLLPRYRGAGPVQWALIEGETETGISIMRTEAGLDTGPVCHVRRTRVGPHERAPELFDRLSRLGAEAIVEALDLLEGGDLRCEPQNESLATVAPLLRKEDGIIDWSQPAGRIYDRFRGVAYWPGARFRFGDREVRVHEMRPVDGSGKPGEVLRVGPEGVVVATGTGALELMEVQPAGKGRIPARDWANGYRVKAGGCLA